MLQSTPIVAFDQHAASLVAAVLLPGQATPTVQTLPPDLPTVRRFLQRVRRTGAVQCCYEAGPCGFDLQRALTADGIACDVIAPALIPRRPGVRIKTDRRDAAHLAILYRAGALTRIHVPTEQEEAVRDLLRCREDIRADLLRARHRLSKFLLRHGRRFTGTKRAWTRDHWAWIRAQAWPLAAEAQTHTAYVRAVDEARARLEAIEKDLQDCLTLEPLADRVGRLRCFRGIDDLTALTIAVELSDPRRFTSARQLMAYIGLVPSEHSSGSKRAQGGITKTGNAHVRRVLVEAAWQYRHHPFVGLALKKRQAGQPDAVIARAWTAQHRLNSRYRRLTGRGKSRQVVVTAIGRELAGFLWGALTQ
jgi:transposase